MPFHYWRNRHWKRFLFGAPAFLALIGVITAGVALARQDPNELARWYSGSAQSVRAKDNKAALAFTETAVRLKGEPSDLMTLAELSLQSGDVARAFAILNFLAPFDKRGYERAHLMLAKLLLSSQSPVPIDNVNAAERHLLRIAYEDGDIGNAASAQLGELYAKTGRTKQAIPFLRRTPYQSYDRVLLAEAALKESDFGTAEAEAKACREAFEAKVIADPSDMNSRHALVRCLMILKEFPAAIGWLEAGIPHAPSPEVVNAMRRDRSDVYEEWLKTLERDPNKSPGARFTLLELALNATPTDSRLLLRLLAFSDPKSVEGARTRKLLQEQLADGRNIGLAHFVLGCFAWQEKDHATAKTHFEQAHKALPYFPAISNNLAWVLANATPPELELALKMIDGALEQVPNQPEFRHARTEFRHTRGNILVKMERWKEAISDLEVALDGGAHRDRDGIHAALAKAYEALGNSSMAEIHRSKIVNKVEKK